MKMRFDVYVVVGWLLLLMHKMMMLRRKVLRIIGDHTVGRRRRDHGVWVVVAGGCWIVGVECEIARHDGVVAR